ncbi:hypothetical protein AVEN_230088-1 [Araneus ventricosus]|uniref:Uncharacterized protein n=1 Tax=Araneus ventricosus TaxID=182803 RepID=A0A4Y2X1W3_ARAVE|nr:hypothetical protein AVEN_230088-1 [Araneus ventricosus]
MIGVMGFEATKAVIPLLKESDRAWPEVNKQAKHSDVRFACPIRALQSYNGALLEYRKPICLPALHNSWVGRASMGIFAQHQRDDVWAHTYDLTCHRPNTDGSSAESSFEPGALLRTGDSNLCVFIFFFYFESLLLCHISYNISVPI